MDLSDYRQVEYRVFNEHKFIVYPKFFQLKFMNNKEFMKMLSKELGRTVEETSILAGKLVSQMVCELQEQKSVCIQELGTFEVKKKMERVSVIPSTGQRILVPPKLVLGFRPSVSLKDKVKYGRENN